MSNKKTTPNNPRWPKGYDPAKQQDLSKRKFKNGGRTRKQLGGGINQPLGGGINQPLGGGRVPIRPLGFKHGKRAKKK